MAVWLLTETAINVKKLESASVRAALAGDN
jgi:hypothetical protein